MTRELMIAIGAGLLVLVGALAYRPLKRWYRKVRRRRGGIYLVRVDHHRNRARRVNGYVGRTNNHHFRKLDHLGRGRHGQSAQPWSDLRPVWRTITLPWWLCWTWVLDPLETLAILLLWPRYNDAKNRWNPRRIPKNLAALQRQARDRGTAVQTFHVWTAHAARYILQGAGVLVILTGLVGFALSSK